MLSVDEIRTLINNDQSSERKKQAETGQRYYDAKHDILGFRIFFMNNDDELIEDKLKSNTRISHPFFTEIADQEVQYILSGDCAFVKSDNPELQELLDSYFNENEDFIAELYEILTDAVVRGFAYAYAYRREEDNKITFERADSLNVVEVRKNATQEHCDYLIHWYIDHIDNGEKEIRRIEVWDEAQTYFYCQIDDGDIVLDELQKINPRPHTIYTKGKDGKTYYDNFGVIPFFCLSNNRAQRSSIWPVKALIDDYDLMNCGLSNNISDTSEALYVIRGYTDDNLDKIALNIKAKKMIGVDEAGGVDVQTVDIPVEARKAKMELDEQNIYRFGMGLNTYGLKDTSATTNIAIKSAYSLLDMKTNKKEIRLKQFIRKLLKLVLDDINKQNGTDYKQSDVYFDFERVVPTNALENAQIELSEAQRKQVEINTLLNLQTHIDNETMMKLIVEQLDLDWEEIKGKLPDPETDGLAEVEAALKTAPVEGDVIE